MNNKAIIEVAGVSMHVEYTFLDQYCVNYALDLEKYKDVPWELRRFLEDTLRQHYNQQITQDLRVHDFHEALRRSQPEPTDLPF